MIYVRFEALALKDVLYFDNVSIELVFLMVLVLVLLVLPYPIVMASVLL